MSNFTDLSVHASTYNNKEAAISDYEAVKALYYELGFMDTFDAAIIQKNEKGKVEIVKRHEQPTRQMGWAGAGLGLATGLIAALFPAVALTGVLVAETTAVGAAVGAITGHVAAGLSRGDLKELGELLDKGEYGLLVISFTDVGERVESTIKLADKVITKALKTDKKELEKDIHEALNS